MVLRDLSHYKFRLSCGTRNAKISVRMPTEPLPKNKQQSRGQNLNYSVNEFEFKNTNLCAQLILLYSPGNYLKAKSYRRQSNERSIHLPIVPFMFTQFYYSISDGIAALYQHAILTIRGISVISRNFVLQLCCTKRNSVHLLWAHQNFHFMCFVNKRTLT